MNRGEAERERERELDVFFREVSIHVFCPFLHWVICFWGVEFDKFLIDLGY